MGRAVKWAAVIGSILLFSNLGYYGYQVLIVDGYGSGAPVPTDPNITVEKPSPSPSAAPALGAVLLPVPFTTQAPLGDWARHQESCEEANLAQVWAYYSGDHSSVLDPHSADHTIAPGPVGRSGASLGNATCGPPASAQPVARIAGADQITGARLPPGAGRIAGVSMVSRGRRRRRRARMGPDRKRCCADGS